MQDTLTGTHGSQQPLASPRFAVLRSCAGLQPPQRPTQFEDEVLCCLGHTEVHPLPEAPDTACEIVEAPEGDDGKFLWLVLESDVPVALEHGQLGRSLKRGRLAHTNLSGPDQAYIGGELWFRDSGSIWLNGGSGRFPAQTAAIWNAAVNGFRAAGYSVCDAGWDDEAKVPSRFFRNQTWLAPQSTGNIS